MIKVIYSHVYFNAELMLMFCHCEARLYVWFGLSVCLFEELIKS